MTTVNYDDEIREILLGGKLGRAYLILPAFSVPVNETDGEWDVFHYGTSASDPVLRTSFIAEAGLSIWDSSRNFLESNFDYSGNFIIENILSFEVIPKSISDPSILASVLEPPYLAVPIEIMRIVKALREASGLGTGSWVREYDTFNPVYLHLPRQ